MTRPATLLLVEDEFLLALQIEDVLQEAGLHVIGPAATLAQAKSLAQNAAFDGALLDVNLRGEHVDEVASILQERGIPFVFTTGYGREHLPAAFRDHAGFLAKPFSDKMLIQAVREHLIAEKEES